MSNMHAAVLLIVIAVAGMSAMFITARVNGWDHEAVPLVGYAVMVLIIIGSALLVP